MNKDLKDQLKEKRGEMDFSGNMPEKVKRKQKNRTMDELTQVHPDPRGSFTPYTADWAGFPADGEGETSGDTSETAEQVGDYAEQAETVVESGTNIAQQLGLGWFGDGGSQQPSPGGGTAPRPAPRPEEDEGKILGMPPVLAGVVVVSAVGLVGYGIYAATR